MTQYSKEIIEIVRKDHPDLSSWSIICANDRAVAPVQYMIHCELGGILPAVRSFDSYTAGKIASLLGLAEVSGDERLFFFTEFIDGYFPDEPRPARLAGAVLPLITKMVAYGVDKGAIAGSDRLTEEQWDRLNMYMDAARAFREWLGKKKLFMAELEAALIDKITPGEREIFIGLPEMTPVRERFYKKIRKERLFIGRPLFSNRLVGIDAPGYDSAKNLVSSFGGDVLCSGGENIELVSLSGLFDLAELVLREVSDFLRDRKPDEQLFIFLLDESLTPMLWSRVFRNFGSAVNVAVWMPFCAMSAGKRLRQEIEQARNSGKVPDFKKYARSAAAELVRNRENYVREECEALETAISFAHLLDHWKERLGPHLADAAKMLIDAGKFRVTGSRSAPVQVVGFGHASGQSFSRALVLSLDSGIMPGQPFEGPFINSVHVPRMRKAVFEYEDLVFRQILAGADKIKIVATHDEARERTPSFYMNLLAQEFNRPVRQAAFSKEVPRDAKLPEAAIVIDESLRERLRNFTYSYSSLAKIMACPYLFYLKYIARLTPPAFMDDEEKINMLMGNFVHRFLARFSTMVKTVAVSWEELFDKMWQDEKNASVRDMEGINIHVLNAKIFLRGIYKDEDESDRRIIFGDNALACEKEFIGRIAGRYRITGVCDRLALIDGKTEVIDFKYSKISDKYIFPVKQSVAESFEGKGDLHPAAQLMIYHHFLPEAAGARFYFLKETGRIRETELPEKEIAQTETLLELIGKRLDEIIAADEILPVTNSDECRYCRFQIFCCRDGFYKSLRRSY